MAYVASAICSCFSFPAPAALVFQGVEHGNFFPASGHLHMLVTVCHVFPCILPTTGSLSILPISVEMACCQRGL